MANPPASRSQVPARPARLALTKQVKEKSLAGSVVKSSETHKVLTHAETDGRAVAHVPALVTNYELGSEPMEMKEPSFTSAKGPRYLDGVGEVFRASELVGNVIIPKDNVSPYIVLDVQLLSPQAYQLSRQRVMSSLWTRFRYRKVTFEFIPSVSQLVGGSLISFFDIDPNNNTSLLSGSELLSRAAFSRTHHMMYSTGQHAACSAAFDGDDYWYYLTDGDEMRLNFQGTFTTLMHASPLFTTAPTTPVTLGTIIMHYEIEFCGARVDSSSIPFTYAGQTLTPSATTPGDDVFCNGGGVSGVDAFGLNAGPGFASAPLGVYKLWLYSATGAVFPAVKVHNGREIQLAPGMTLWGRLITGASGNIMCFWVDPTSAFSGDFDSNLRWTGVNQQFLAGCTLQLIYSPPDD